MTDAEKKKTIYRSSIWNDLNVVNSISESSVPEDVPAEATTIPGGQQFGFVGSRSGDRGSDGGGTARPVKIHARPIRSETDVDRPTTPKGSSCESHVCINHKRT